MLLVSAGFHLFDVVETEMTLTLDCSHTVKEGRRPCDVCETACGLVELSGLVDTQT
jgi:hypothetical protein